MTEVAFKVTAESNVSEVLSKDSAAVAAAQEIVTGNNSKMSEGNKANEASVSSLSGALRDSTGALSAVSGEMGDLVGKTSELTKAIGEAVGGEGGLGIAGLAGVAGVAVGAFAELGASGANLATQISQVSAVTGMSIEKTDYWGNALADVGGNVNSLVMVNRLLTSSMESLSVAQEKGGPLTQKQSDLLTALGGSATDASGHVKNFADAFPQLIQSLSSMTNEQDRARVGTEIFGRSWGQISLLIAEYPKVAGAAEEQTKRNAKAMEDANNTAVDFHIAMHNLETEYEAVALKFAKPLTLTLKVTGDIFDFIGKDKTQTWAGQMDEFIGKEAAGAFDKLTSAVGRYTTSAGESIGVTSSLDNNTTVLSTNASQAANAADAAAAGIIHAGNAAGSAVPLVTAAAGAFGMLRSAMAGAGTIFQEVTTGENGLVLADINLIKSNKDKSDAMEKAYQALAASADPVEHAIGQEHLDAEAKKETTAALKEQAQTIPGMVQALRDQSVQTQMQTEAQREYNAEMGIATDLEGKALPTMHDLVNAKIDSYNATLRDNEANREANAILGLQTDINGKVIKSFQELVAEKKQSILASQEDQKAMDEANKELGIVSASVASTSSSLNNLTSSLAQATLGWHQMTDAESQSSAKARQSTTSGGGGSSGGAVTGGSGGGSSGGSVAYFSSGYGGGQTEYQRQQALGGGNQGAYLSGLQAYEAGKPTSADWHYDPNSPYSSMLPSGGGGSSGSSQIVPHAPSGPGTWIYGGTPGRWTNYSDPGQLNDPNLVYNSALGGYVSYSDPGTNPLQARASGGAVTSGQPYTVGERGPETFVPSQNGTIIPNGSGMGGGLTIVVNINGDTYGMADLEAKITQVMRDSGRRGGGYGTPFGSN